LFLLNKREIPVIIKYCQPGVITVSQQWNMDERMLSRQIMVLFPSHLTNDYRIIIKLYERNFTEPDTYGTGKKKTE
jgi:hypothetical protein